MCHPRPFGVLRAGSGGDLYEKIRLAGNPGGAFLCVYEKPQACARGVLDIFSNYLSSLKYTAASGGSWMSTF